ERRSANVMCDGARRTRALLSSGFSIPVVRAAERTLDGASAIAARRMEQREWDIRFLGSAALLHQIAQLAGDLMNRYRRLLNAQRPFGRGFGGARDTGNIARDFARALGCFLHVAPDLSGSDRLLLDGRGNGVRNIVDLRNDSADFADRLHRVVRIGLYRSDL